MVPDEELQATPEPTPSESPAPRRRRSRRGGRRHSRGRRAGHPLSPPTESGAPASASTETENAPEPQPQSAPQRRISAVGKAIEEVNVIIVELKHVLEHMDEVIETLELAERQKIEDAHEIESLRRALHQLHRPREGGKSHH